MPQPIEVSVSLLDAGTVTAFMVAYCRDRNTNSVKSMARSVRSYATASNTVRSEWVSRHRRSALAPMWPLNIYGEHLDQFVEPLRRRPAAA